MYVVRELCKGGGASKLVRCVIRRLSSPPSLSPGPLFSRSHPPPHFSHSHSPLSSPPISDVEFWHRVKTMVGHTVLAVESRLGRMQRASTYGETTYEILGYDIVLDDQLEPYLCEVRH